MKERQLEEGVVGTLQTHTEDRKRFTYRDQKEIDYKEINTRKEG